MWGTTGDFENCGGFCSSWMFFIVLRLYMYFHISVGGMCMNDYECKEVK